MGQCTPSTKREKATSSIHRKACTNAASRVASQRRLKHRAAAQVKAATTSVCPLGKLEPQYHCVSHRAGRVRPTRLLATLPQFSQCLYQLAEIMCQCADKARRRSTSLCHRHRNRLIVNIKSHIERLDLKGSPCRCLGRSQRRLMERHRNPRES